MIVVTDKEKQVLFHTLGLNYGDQIFRNCFLASANHHNMTELLGLAEKGLMQRGNTPGFCDPNDWFFYATKLGEEFASSARLSENKKLSRSQRRYKAYLNADIDCTFGEWIKSRG